MLRAWRTHDFRSIFHLACKVGVTPEVIADSTGLPVDLVLNVMKGNTSLTGDSGAGESVASGLGMPQDVRGILGLAPARPRPVAAGPLAPKSKAGTSVNEQPITIKLRGDVGERIAELRYERGLTQEQLAERAGISAVMVSKLEQHARTPSLAMLDSVATALGVVAGELLEPPLVKGQAGRKKWRLPDYLPADILGRPDFVAACQARDLGAVFQIATEAGFMRSHLARRCEMTVSQVSAYIQRARKAHDVDIFCRASDGLHIPGAMFGIGRREWESEESGQDSQSKPKAAGKRNLAREKRELRQEMRSAGLDYRQIAAEFARIYQLRPRTAWREAYGWTLQETADRINAFRGDTGIDPNSICGMTPAHLSEYETWPGNGADPAGRRPKPPLLAVLAALYQCQLHDLIDLADRQHYTAADLLLLDTLTDAKSDSPAKNSLNIAYAETSQAAPAKLTSPLRPHIPLSYQFTLDDEQRLAYAAKSPRSHDPAVVDALAVLLSDQRKTEDSVGSVPLIRPVSAQLVVVTDLVTEARGDLRAKVLDVGSQWAQFAGWLHASGGQVAKANRLYGLALEWATEAGSADMIATALNMRGHAAWIASKVGPMVGLSRAAQRVGGISPGVRALAVQQEARGTALAGDATVADIDREFDEAEELVAQAMSHPDREPPWIYFFSPHYLIMQRGLAYRLAGEHIKAVELIEAGLAAVPHEVRQSDWIASYLIQLALIYARSGDVAAACKLAVEVLQIGRQTHSKRLNADIRSLHARLCQIWPGNPAVADLEFALQPEYGDI